VWGLTIPAVAVAVSLAVQLCLMPRLVSAPARNAPWYNATGVSLYVLGMMAAALGLGGYV
ncbi:MAG: bacteriochlorophyll/chlorophyll synthetase, partial [Novosphingobium sp.]